MRPIATFLAAVLLPAAVAGGKITVTGVGAYTLIDTSGGGAGGLSDIAMTGIGASTTHPFIAVNDSNNNLYPLALTIDPVSGALLNGTIGSPLALRNAAGSLITTTRDNEGAAYNPVNHSVWVSTEVGPVVTEHSLATGNQLNALPVPAVYNSIVANKGLESVTRNASGRMWIANEEALASDPAGTVRLTRFDSLAPAGQFLYDTDSYLGISGVSALLLVDDGSLIVLERAAGFAFRVRLYLVSFMGATDVTGVGALAGGEARASKSLLWEGTFPSQTNSAVNNFEGITLGPTLAAGERSLILVADNDSSANLTHHSLYALRIAITLPGDANNDGTVDGEDLRAVEDHFGATGGDNGLLWGDANDDGRVDGDDYIYVERHFGDAWPAAAVPEPATAAVLALAAMLAPRRGGDRSRSHGRTSRRVCERGGRGATAALNRCSVCATADRPSPAGVRC